MKASKFLAALKVPCPLCEQPAHSRCVRVGPFLAGRPCGTHNERLREARRITEAEIDAVADQTGWPAPMLSEFTRAKLREFAHGIIALADEKRG